MVIIFGNGQMENLFVGVVDGDNIVIFCEIICMIEVVFIFCIIWYYVDEVEVRVDVQWKSIYGYFSILFGFEVKVMDGKEIVLIYYYYYVLMSVGSEIYGVF